MTPITVPDLGIPADEPIQISCWLVRRGEAVVTGDRLVELLIGEITFDIPAPATGKLADIRVHVDQAVLPGTLLGHVLESAD
ncbi:lipoyl domain-containing protein [bacterium]|nr:lipoyl domain-containing protein [bacterium]